MICPLESFLLIIGIILLYEQSPHMNKASSYLQISQGNINANVNELYSNDIMEFLWASMWSAEQSGQWLFPQSVQRIRIGWSTELSQTGFYSCFSSKSLACFSLRQRHWWLSQIIKWVRMCVCDKFSIIINASFFFIIFSFSRIRGFLGLDYNATLSEISST